MRAKFYPLVGALIVLMLSGFTLTAAPAGNSAAAAGSAPALSPKLQATNAGDAWDELQAAMHPPAGPESWRTTPPTPKEEQQFYLPFVRALTGKARDFYTRFPKDSNVPAARMMEFKFLYMTVAWGDTTQETRLDTLEKSILKDASMPEDARVSLLHSIASADKPEKARPLLEDIAANSTSAALKSAATDELGRLKALGKPVDLRFTAVDGREVDLSKLKGKVVLIDFWATWCGPCVGEVPNVKKTYDQFHGRGFEIIGISLDKEKDKLLAFTAGHKMEWPQYFDGMYWQNKYARQFGIESIPAMWLIDKKGNLRDMNARENLSEGVQKLLAE